MHVWHHSKLTEDAKWKRGKGSYFQSNKFSGTNDTARHKDIENNL